MRPVQLTQRPVVHETATWNAALHHFYECGFCGAPISAVSPLARRYMIIPPARLIAAGRLVRAASLTLDQEIEGVACEVCAE